MYIKDALNNNAKIINLATGIATFVIQLGISFVLSPYIVRTLGPAANGFTQLANNFVTYANLITLAFNSMGGRFMTIHYHRDEIDKTNAVYSSICISNLLLIIIMLPISMGVIWKLDRIIVIGDYSIIDARTLFSCVFANYFVGLFLSICHMAMYVTNKLYIANMLSMVRLFLNAILLLCLFSIFEPRMYYVSLAALLLTILYVPIYGKIRRKLLPNIRFRISSFQPGVIKELLKSGVWNTVNQCGNMLMTGLDLLLANLFISPDVMGTLSVSKTIPAAIVSLSGILNTSFAPTLTINWAKSDTKSLLAELRQCMRISNVLVAIPIGVFCVYGTAFYRLWQPTLNPTELSVLSLLALLAFIPLAGTQVLYNVFTSTNKLKLNSITFLITGFCNTGIVYLLLKYTSMGVYAIAGVSAVLTILRNLIFVLPYAAHLLNLKWYIFYREVGTSLILSIAVFTIAYVIKLIIQPDSWLFLILSAGIAACVSVAAAWFIVLNKDDRIKLLSKIRG